MIQPQRQPEMPDLRVVSVADLLLQLNRDEAVTLIVVTHNAALARRIGRTFELAQGKLKEVAR